MSTEILPPTILDEGAPVVVDDAPADAAELERALGLRFTDRALLGMALTHRSYLNEAAAPHAANNERLEFLGDAVLDFVVAEHLYRTLPDAQEGPLTTLRSHLVCRSALAGYADRLALGRYLYLGRGEAAGGGRARRSVLSDAFEAVVGALYLDQGLAAARDMALSFVGPELASVLAEQRQADAKTRLQELAQGRMGTTPRYETVAEEGPGHERNFVVQVRLGSETWGTGSGSSKAMAARRAAVEALARIERLDEASAEEHLAGASEAVQDA
jgi:ribonuclease-3